MTVQSKAVLPYRLYRSGAQYLAATTPDGGEHGMTIAHRLGRQHKAEVGDVLVLQIGTESYARIAYRFERWGQPVPIKMPEGLKP